MAVGALILLGAIGVWLARDWGEPARTWYKDGDEDGFSDGTLLKQANRPPGYFLEEELLALSGDCDDKDATIFPRPKGEAGGYPAAVEICDGKDNDCNGAIDDGLGAWCEHFREDVSVPEKPVRPGEPIWVAARFTNSSGRALQTIRPDCFNTTFTLLDEHGRVVPPRYRIRRAYGIPLDVVTLPPGHVDVHCDLAEMVRPEELASGAGSSPKTYQVLATYSNFIRDPDLAADGKCGAPKGECYDLWTGAVGSASKAVVTVQGEAVTRDGVEVRFHPPDWAADWAADPGRRIKVKIEGIDRTRVDPTEPVVLLNGAVPAIPWSVAFEGKTLIGEFDRAEAVKSLGTLVQPLPDFVYSSVDVVTPKGVYSGKAAVGTKGRGLAERETAQ